MSLKLDPTEYGNLSLSTVSHYPIQRQSCTLYSSTLFNIIVCSFTLTVKPVDITDLLDSHLSHQPDSDQQPEQPTVTTNHHSNNNQDQDHSNSNDIDQKPDTSNPQPSTHPLPPSGSTPASTTLYESTFANGILPDHPLQGLKPTDQDHSNDNKINEGSSTGTTEGAGKNGSANIEGSVKNEANPRDDNSNKVSTVNLGVFIAIIVMVIIFVLILIGVLKEHKYLRFRGAVCLRRGKVPVHSNGKVNGAMKLRSNPKKTLHSLLGPSQLGFSRLRTYDSDSEEEEFPVFNRV